MKNHNAIRIAFSILFSIDVAWMVFLFARHLAAGDLTAYLGWGWAWILFFGILPLIIIFIFYEFILYVKKHKVINVKYTKISRYLAISVVVVNIVSNVYNGYLDSHSSHDVISRPPPPPPPASLGPQPPSQSRS